MNFNNLEETVKIADDDLNQAYRECVDTVDACTGIDGFRKVNSAKPFLAKMVPEFISDAWMKELQSKTGRMPVLTSDLEIVQCADGQSTVRKPEMQMYHAEGEISATGAVVCASPDILECGNQNFDCTTLGDNITSAQLYLMSMDVETTLIKFKFCLTQYNQFTQKHVFAKELADSTNGQIDMGTKEGRYSVADAIVRTFNKAVNKRKARMALIRQATDLGKLSTVLAVLDTTLTTVTVRVSAPYKLIPFKYEGYAVIRPGVDNAYCDPICTTGNTFLYVGYASLQGTPKFVEHTVTFCQQKDLNGDVMPLPAIQAGDMLFATEQIAGVTMTFGGAPYSVYPATIGFTAGMDEVAAEAPGCCKSQGGIWGAVRNHKVQSIPEIRGYNLLTQHPDAFEINYQCCPITDFAAPVGKEISLDELESAVSRASHNLDTFKAIMADNKYLSPLTNVDTIIIEAGPRTMQSLYQSTVGNLGYATQVLHNNPDGSFTGVLDPRDRYEINFPSTSATGYRVVMRTSNYFLEEGEVYVGPEFGDAHIVYSDLNGTDWDKFNYGLLQRTIPLEINEDRYVTPSSMMDQQSNFIYYKIGCHGTLPRADLIANMTMYDKVVALLYGAATFWKNVNYTLPFECATACREKSCECAPC